MCRYILDLLHAVIVCISSRQHKYMIISSINMIDMSISSIGLDEYLNLHLILRAIMWCLA